jgi:hypothetical protein
VARVALFGGMTLERVMNFGDRIAGYDPQELPQ